jgi:thiol:disulfide interchange protein DsbD
VPLIRLLGGTLLAFSLAATARPFGTESKRDALLPAEQAFELLPVEHDARGLHLSWNIAPGYYLYRQRIRVEALAPSPAALQPIHLPQGIDHVDDHFGAVQIYRGLLEARVPTTGLPVDAPLRLRITYQGCADLGVCYPPQTVLETLSR